MCTIPSHYLENSSRRDTHANIVRYSQPPAENSGRSRCGFVPRGIRVVSLDETAAPQALGSAKIASGVGKSGYEHP